MSKRKRTMTTKKLIQAAAEGDLRIVIKCVKEKVKIRAHNDQALRIASEKGYAEIVRVLLEAGADAYVSNDLPLRLAAKHGHREVVKIILEET